MCCIIILPKVSMRLEKTDDDKKINMNVMESEGDSESDDFKAFVNEEKELSEVD